MFIYILVVCVLITLVSGRVHADDTGKAQEYGLRASLDLQDGGNMATFKHFSSSSFRNCRKHKATEGLVPSGHPDKARF